MNPLETYLHDLNEIRSSGAAVKETSSYGPLASLFNEIGKTLKPKVKCIINLQNQGAGLPDGGFFTQEQFQKAGDHESMPGQMPARGAIEVKSTKDDALVTADGDQVTRYLGRYRQVLVTNYRDFVLVGQDASDQAVKLEIYRLAESEATFWEAAAHPRRTAQEHGERFTEYLKRVMLHAAPLAAPKDLAWFLASYARDAKVRLEGKDLPALTSLRTALEEALGLKFEGDKGDHFFRSTLVQTLFYGVFAAWVLWHKKNPIPAPKKLFDWRLTPFYLRVPMIRVLYEQVAAPSKLGPLGLEEVLDWTTTVLNRVDRPAFFSQFDEGHAVQYFYEPFLKAFDPELRKDLGVWFTPPEIVQYMVARVDTVLREELEIADGLADPRVYVLDPCCGTGAYLVEVLKHIHGTLRANRDDALVAHDLKNAARDRVFGFEILPAPFVVAHLQLGLLLANLGAPLAEETAAKEGERARVYLTNALTGWEPPTGPKKQLTLPEFEAERDAAEDVKRDKPILVILGNPPYNAFAGVSATAEKILVEPYKEGLISRWGIKKFNLDDLYVRFFGMAERRIAGMTGKGVVSYISNHSWVSDSSFVVLRQRLLASFDRFWIENMHGNRKISEYAPDGRTSETIFAIPGFSPGIQQGVAISLWVKSGKKDGGPKVFFRDDLNAAKAVDRRTQLLESLEADDFDAPYQPANPEKSNRFSFLPSEVAAHYLAWPKLVDLCAEKPFVGLEECRGGVLIDIDRYVLEKRMQIYFNPDIDWEMLNNFCKGLTKNAARFDAKKARLKILLAESFDHKNICRFSIRPFDKRWCYFSLARPLWNEPRPTLWPQCWKGNKFIISRFNAQAKPEGIPIYISEGLFDKQTISRNPGAIPVFLSHNRKTKISIHPTLLKEEAREPILTANLSPSIRSYLAALGLPDPDADAETAALIWMHALAIGYAPAYLTENHDGIRQDWPRIPLPDTREALEHSVLLGRELAALLDPETSVPGVTAGALRPELKPLAMISKVGGGALNPDAGDLALTVGWGHGGKDGITMPGKGKVVRRDYTPEELAAIREGAPALGLTPEQAIEHLGESTYDIYLNEVAYWQNIPDKVWNYYIGGYQVIKKWLSYREKTLLGRPLTPDEVREVTHMARRLAAIVLTEPALNANYLSTKESVYTWPVQVPGRC
jgi:hypothetical protein